MASRRGHWIVICAVGCATPRGAEPPRVESHDGAAAPVADDGETKVVLVEAGAEPRRALRYVYGKNVETVQLDTKLGSSTPRKGVPEPDDSWLQTIRLVMTLTPVSVDGTGALTE